LNRHHIDQKVLSMTQITLEMMRTALYSAVVADALDALGYREQSPRIELRPWTVDGVLIGRCKTTLWGDLYHPDPDPYALELKAVDACQPDDVLICAAGGSMHSALWGELLSTAARRTGCVGAIIDGAIRDLHKLRQMQFPVYARGTRVHDSLNRQRVVDLDVPVEIAGVRFHPGELVIADADGIVVVPHQVEAAAIERAWNKVHAENQVRDAIRNGLSATAAFQKYGIL